MLEASSTLFTCQTTAREDHRPRVSGLRPMLVLSDPTRPSLPTQQHWWRRTGLNRRPPACKAGALPLSYAPFGPARFLVGPGRFELPTSRLSSARSNQLSYEPGSLREPATARSQFRIGKGCAGGGMASVEDQADLIARTPAPIPSCAGWSSGVAP